VRRCLLLGLLLLLVVAAGCGSHSLAVSADGSGVMTDALDGHLNKSWSCGSLLTALSRFSPTVMDFAGVPAAAGKACDLAVRQVAIGMTSEAVRNTLGAPQVGGVSVAASGCWFYAWPPVHTSPVNGARICFKGSRVRLIQPFLAA
jgi:hypothetical protein